MLSLNAGSTCDVCAEEYSQLRQPHCIPCGHVLCLTCTNGIVQRTSSRSTPTCPYCREEFRSDDVRLIRIEYLPTRRQRAGTFGSIESDPPHSPVQHKFHEHRGKTDARQLEAKVAQIAAKKCSVEEVRTLQHELQEFLKVDGGKTPSLALSSALLNAILTNHRAHADAIKTAKATEAQLHTQLRDKEDALKQVDAQARGYRNQLAGTRSEGPTTRSFATGFSSASTSPNSSTPNTPATSPRSQNIPALPSLYPSAPTSRTTSTASGRFPAIQSHHRSVSASPSPSPSPMRRSQTPAPAQPFRSPTPNMRSQTPGPGGAHTAFRMPNMLSPQKRLYASPPISRSSSDETEHGGQHERWLPEKVGVAI